MCQATVYLEGNKNAEDVIWLEPTEHGVTIRTLFGESRLTESTLHYHTRMRALSQERQRRLPIGVPRGQPIG